MFVSRKKFGVFIQMIMLIFVAVSLWAALLLPPVAYYVWLVKKKGALRVRTDSSFQPNVSLIVPTYNEAKVVGKKLENIQELDYPEKKLRIILVDSASNDGTMDVCKAFLERTPFRFQITLISEKERLGKSSALNLALKQADGEIIATSDADSFWDADALRKAVSYFADQSVGAVTGREKLANAKKNVYTMSEGLYKEFFNTMRLGESSIHSTLFIHGELALYRRSAFGKFEDKPGYSDDNGTAVNIMSRGYRCIFAPESVFSDNAAVSLNGRLTLKSRRAEHLIASVVRSLRLKFEKKFPVPWRVVLFNFYLHVISPLLLVATLFATAIVYVIDFRLLWFLAFLLAPFFMKKPRVFAVSYLTSNLALIIGLLPLFTKKRSATWRKVDEMR
jgi:biofilm PGA synthesis N-glycosyltransferase PgaC